MPVWPGACLVCGTPMRRRWWQRGLLTPLPLCRHWDAYACHLRSLTRRR